MDRHAGYAVAMNLRSSMLQDMQRVAYHAGQIEHRLSGSMSGTSADLFLDLPKLECRKSDGNQVRLNIQAWGPLTVTPASVPETRTVLFETTVLAPPSVGIVAPTETKPAQITLSLQTTLPEVVSLRVTPLAGGPYSQAAQDYLASNEFKIGVGLLIGSRLSMMSPSALDAKFLGGIAANSDASVTPVVLDGVLAIGIDVFGVEVDGVEIATSGDPNLLIDFTEGNDIAIWMNPRTVSVAFDNVEKKIEKKVNDQGANLDYYSFVVEEGRFSIWGGASNSEGNVNFSMKAVPSLLRPGHVDEWDEEYGEHFVMVTPDRRELWFDMQDVVVDVHLSWWAAALASIGSVITLGIGVFVVEALLDMKRGNVTNDIEQEEDASQAAVDQEFTLPGTTEPVIRLTLLRFECHDEGVFIGSTLRPQFGAPYIRGDGMLPAELALIRSVTYKVKLPFDVLADDPQVNVRWTVRRNDTNETLLSLDGQAAGLLSIGFDHNVAPFLECPKFGIECRVYRTLGATITELFGDTLTLTVFDPLDRSHPYVHWTHEAYTPEVRVEANGAQTILGYVIKGRRSKIHRTDLPGRCKFVSHFSIQKLRDPGLGVTPSVIEYLDELPFPVDDLVQHRSKVCDYCFFGGPSRKTPIFPI